MLRMAVAAGESGPLITMSGEADITSEGQLREVLTTQLATGALYLTIDEGTAPDAVAGLVADAIAANRFWVFTDPRFTQVALNRWQRIAEGQNPQADVDVPGMPPAGQLAAEIRRLLAGPGGAL